MASNEQCNNICNIIFPGIREMFTRRKLTDVIVCYGKDGSKEKGAHKLVLCNASKKWKAALLDNSFKEKQEGRIDLMLEDQEVAEALLSTVYGITYDDKHHAACTMPQLMFNIDVYLAAQYALYDFVCDIAVQKFGLAVAHAMRTDAGIAILTDAARTVYEETPEHEGNKMRETVTNFCVYYKDRLLPSPGFNELLKSNAELSADMNYALSAGNTYMPSTLNFATLAPIKKTSRYFSDGAAGQQG